MATEELEVSNAQTINESVAPLRGLIVACGPAASYMAAAAVSGFKVTTQGLRQLVASAAQAGTLDTGGQNFQTGPKWDLEQYGISSSVSTPTSQTGLQATLDNALNQNKPIVLGLSNANQLTDEPPGLHGHFITIFGKNTDNSYITGDPNTIAASEGHFTNNTLGQLWDSDVQSISIPGRGAEPGNINDIGVDFSIGFPQSVFDSFGSALGNGIASGITSGERQVVQDISQSVGGIYNLFMRVAVAGLGAFIFLLSFDKFLGTFSGTELLGKPGPIESSIRSSIQETKDKVSDAAKVAETALAAGA